MSEQIHADKAGEQVSSDSGLLLSAEPLEGGRLSALGDDSSDVDESDGGDSDGIAGGDEDTGGLTDADASDEADADGTDGGDSVESESGLGGENPLGINRNRVRNGDDKDTRDT